MLLAHLLPVGTPPLVRLAVKVGSLLLAARLLLDFIRSVYRVRPRIAGLDELHLAEERQRRSTFVLITTVPRTQLSAHALLWEYKHQSSLERRFAFLKDPEVVDSFFLKKPERVQALGYVLLMVCLIFSVLERRVRQTAARLPTIARGSVVNPTGL